jgi:methionine synthase II (cobalamin-independent)
VVSARELAFTAVDHTVAFFDATRLAIHDQEEAGLDIVTDGQLVFDDKPVCGSPHPVSRVTLA